MIRMILGLQVGHIKFAHFGMLSIGTNLRPITQNSTLHIYDELYRIGNLIVFTLLFVLEQQSQ
jgi:hypothetical protein